MLALILRGLVYVCSGIAALTIVLLIFRYIVFPLATPPLSWTAAHFWPSPSAREDYTLIDAQGGDGARLRVEGMVRIALCREILRVAAFDSGMPMAILRPVRLAVGGGHVINERTLWGGRTRVWTDWLGAPTCGMWRELAQGDTAAEKIVADGMQELRVKIGRLVEEKVGPSLFQGADNPEATEALRVTLSEATATAEAIISRVPRDLILPTMLVPRKELMLRLFTDSWLYCMDTVEHCTRWWRNAEVILEAARGPAPRSVRTDNKLRPSIRGK